MAVLLFLALTFGAVGIGLLIQRLVIRKIQPVVAVLIAVIASVWYVLLVLWIAQGVSWS